MRLNIYLFFNGTCADAFAFYQDVLGGEILMSMPYKGTPGESHAPADWHDKIMHTSLQVGDMTLMGSDALPGHYNKPQGFDVSVNLTDPDEADRIFNALSQGGKVNMPLEKTFWAQKFGSLTDRFGIHWMINCE